MRIIGPLIAALALTACPGRPVHDAAFDGDAASDVVAVDAGPVMLPTITSGDVQLRAASDGSFELWVGGRVLLAAPAGPIAAQQYRQVVRSEFGIWQFERDHIVEARPSANATATLDGNDMVLTIADASGTATMRFTRATDEVTLHVAITTPNPASTTVVRFRCDADAHFLGFGEQYNDIDHRGRAFPLFVSEQGIGREPAIDNFVSGNHTTTYFPVPFFLDPRGFGLAVDTDARTFADLCASDPNVYSLAPDVVDGVLLHLYTGPTVRDVMRAWTVRQGRSSMPPSWAVTGAWIAAQGGSDVVRANLATAQDAGVPVAAMWVQDWLGHRDIGSGNYGVRYHWSADTTLYPDLQSLISELHAAGVRFLGYFNPFVVDGEDLWSTAVAQNDLPTLASGAPYEFAINTVSGSVVDLTNPAAEAWYRSYARAAIALGMDGWMQDFGEWLPTDAHLFDGRDASRYHNLYPQDWHAAARAELDAEHPGDWVMFSRSGWLGEASVAQVVWAGDQEASWSADDGLPTVIPAITSLGLAGIGFVTLDVAGFSGGPSTQELYERWVELAAFAPIFRTHDGLMRATNWRWDRDATTLAHFARFARVHAALAPEFMQLGAEHQMTGMPIVRSLALEFPDDPATRSIRDEFMVGDALLVAPVVTEGDVARDVYLPAGTWFDVWDPMMSWIGPATIHVDAPIGRPPVFSATPRTDLAAIQ